MTEKFAKKSKKIFKRRSEDVGKPRTAPASSTSCPSVVSRDTGDTIARRMAFRVLEQLDERPAQAVLNSVLGTAPGLSASHRALCAELVYGVLRAESRLNFLIDQYLRDAAKTPPRLRLLLQMAVYGLLYMDRTPAPLTVDACVRLTRELCGPGLAKVANGVLRAFLRGPWAGLDADALWSGLVTAGGGGLPGLSIASGLPLWMLKLWADSKNSESPPCAAESPSCAVEAPSCAVEALARAANTLPWSCVRVNAGRPDAAQLRETLLSYEGSEAVGAWGIRFDPRHRPEMLDTLNAEGRLSRQGAGSLLLLETMLPFLQGRVWDGCAGFGGKTLALLERRVNVVAASDVHRGRLSGLRAEATRLNLPVPALFLASAAHPPLAAGSVDTILLDVPCSGLGTLARRPDLRRHRTAEHIPPLVALQREILDAAWAIIPSGGIIIYATCALNPEENELQIQRFLNDCREKSSGATLLAEHTPQPDAFGSDLLYGAALRKE